MAIRGKCELISGVSIGTFGIYVLYEASKLSYLSEFGPGPGFFPLWIGTGLVVFALVLVLANIFGLTSGGETEPQSWSGVGRSLSGWLGLTIGIAILPWVGFGVSFAFLTAFLVSALERRPLLATVTVALGLALGLHLIFAVALGLRLPSGPWGF